MIATTWIREFLGLPVGASINAPQQQAQATQVIGASSAIAVPTTTYLTTSEMEAAGNKAKPASEYQQLVRATLRDHRTGVPVELVSVRDSLESKLLFSPRLSDVTFVFDDYDEKIPAHRLILASRSDVFRAMFFNGFAEGSSAHSRIVIHDIDPKIFRTMLRCMYTDVIMPRFKASNVFAVLQCAKVYQFNYLAQRCVRYISKSLTPASACTLLSQSMGLLDEEKLVLKCIEDHTSEAFNSDEFLHLSKVSLAALLISDRLNEDEVQIFGALVRWTIAELERQSLPDTPVNRQLIAADLIPFIRFPCMTVQDIALAVTRSSLLTSSQLLEIFQWFGQPMRPRIRYPITARQGISTFMQWDTKTPHPHLKLSMGNTRVEYTRSSADVTASGNARPEITQRSSRPIATGTYSVRMEHTSGWIYSVGVCTAAHINTQTLGTDAYSWAYQYNGSVRGVTGIRQGPSSITSYGANVVNIAIDTTANTLAVSLDTVATTVVYRSLPSQPLYLAVSLGWPGSATILAKPLAAGATLPKPYTAPFIPPVNAPNAMNTPAAPIDIAAATPRRRPLRTPIPILPAERQ